jgi:hypothetical protein
MGTTVSVLWTQEFNHAMAVDKIPEDRRRKTLFRQLPLVVRLSLDKGVGMISQYVMRQGGQSEENVKTRRKEGDESKRKQKEREGKAIGK